MNYENYISAECSKVTTNKYTFSLAPNIVPASKSEPYKMYDQSKSGVNLIVSPTGGKQVKFRLSIPQVIVISDVVMESLKNATTEKQKWETSKNDYEKREHLNYFDITKAWGDDQFVRIFGDPDENGLCPVRKLILQRNPLTQDRKTNTQVIANQPWNIGILNGRGKKLTASTGGFYMKSGSFVQDQAQYVHLSDGSMADLFVPARQIVDIFVSGTKDSVFTGYGEIIRQSNSYKR